MQEIARSERTPDAYDQETPAETEARLDAWTMDLLTRFEQFLAAWGRQQGAESASLATRLELSQAIAFAAAACLASTVAWQRTVCAMAETGDRQDFDACRDAILAQLSQIVLAPVEDGERPATKTEHEWQGAERSDP